MTAKRNPKLTRKVQGIVTRKKQEFRDEQIVHFLIIVTCCFLLASFFQVYRLQEVLEAVGAFTFGAFTFTGTKNHFFIILTTSNQQLPCIEFP